MDFGPPRRSFAAFSRARDVVRRVGARLDRRAAFERERRARRGVLRARRRHRRPRWWLPPLVILTLIWLAWPVYSLAQVVFQGRLNVSLVAHATNVVCGPKVRPYCTVVKDALWPYLTAASALSLFIFWSFTRVIRKYWRRARNGAKDLVQTAGTLISDVVGRDHLCQVLINDLWDKASRRPHVLIGGVGTGKTAVLVKLTEVLAGKKFVPVPIKLEDTGNDLDFEQMARDRFTRLINDHLDSDGQADKIWRRLRKDDQVVVLADGLDEALTNEDDRNNILRQAIRQAVEAKLPLVIASRPHDPLRAMEVVVTELEQLGEEPALEYAARDSGGQRPDGDPVLDRQRTAQLIDAVEIAEAPLYLELIRRLSGTGRLWSILTGELLPETLDKPAESAACQRWRLRVKLLDGWKDGLIDGYLYEDYQLDRNCRTAVIEVLSGLACISLARKTSTVTFADLCPPAENSTDGAGRNAGTGKAATGQSDTDNRLSEKIEDALNRELKCVNQTPLLRDLPLAATLGMELGIVATSQQTARFQHSVIQAYLGSRYLYAALDDDNYVREAFFHPSPEFRLALLFGFAQRDERRRVTPEKLARAREVPEHPDTRPSSRALATRNPTPPGPDQPWVVARSFLCQKAGHEVGHDNVTALQVFSTLIELDSMQKEYADPARVIEVIGKRWKRISQYTVDLDRQVEKAKHELMRRIGEAVRGAATRLGQDGQHKLDAAYRAFYELLLQEDTYPIRLAGARELGDGGKEAAEALQPCLEAAEDHDGQLRNQRQQMPDCDGDAENGDGQGRRRRILGAWLAPLMYSAALPQTSPKDDTGAEPQEAKTAARWLDKRLAELRQASRLGDESRHRIAFEIALAQGFRLAANKRGYDHTPYRYRQARLIDRTEEALSYSRYWFSQLTLIQALTLLSLPANPTENLPRHGHGSNPHKQVQYWIRQAGSQCAATQENGGRRPHPFVQAAGDLCVLALTTRRPAEYCWIDENSVVNRVGSQSLHSGTEHNQQFWIADSTGWSGLDPQAQRLLADVQVLLNLTRYYEDTVEADKRLSRADRSTLPPCITVDRAPLDPDRTMGSAKVSEPGANCLDDCPFRLCPYPPKGQPHYTQLSEGFCIKQEQLLGPWFSPYGGASWQHQPRTSLKRFWQSMADRERPKQAPVERPPYE